jgi:ribosome-binding factor A
LANPRTIARLEARIRERVAYCLEFELNDPRVTFATVTRVELTSDLSSAKVYYSVMGTPADQRTCQRALESATGFVRRQLGRVLRTRTIPKLAWFYDDSIRHAAEMDLKIREALAKDKLINPGAHVEGSQDEVDALMSASRATELDRLEPTIPKPVVRRGHTGGENATRPSSMDGSEQEGSESDGDSDGTPNDESEDRSEPEAS